MRSLRFALVTLFVGYVAFPAGLARALPSGGSIGGGGWSGGGASSGGGTGLDVHGETVPVEAAPLASLRLLLLFTLGGVAATAAVVLVLNPRRSRGSPPPDRTHVRVGLLHVALDAAVTTKIQTALAHLATSVDTSTGEGRIRLLHETATLLRRHVHHARYVGGAIEAPAARAAARRRFHAHVADARARLDGEALPAPTSASDASSHVPVRAHLADGLGLVLVTLVVVARGDNLGAAPTDAPSLHAALRSACNILPHELTAVQVVWTPSRGDDLLDAFALEARLGSTLTKLAGSVVGTAHCAYCGTRYRAELVRCSHCGGQAAVSEPAAPSPGER